MPIIAYVCECGKTYRKFIKHVTEQSSSVTCTECGKQAKKTLSAPSSSSSIRIDNGVQARAVEVSLKVIESNKDTAKAKYKKKEDLI